MSGWGSCLDLRMVWVAAFLLGAHTWRGERGCVRALSSLLCLMRTLVLLDQEGHSCLFNDTVPKHAPAQGQSFHTGVWWRDTIKGEMEVTVFL